MNDFGEIKVLCGVKFLRNFTFLRNTEGTQKKDFGAIPCFLEIANVGEAYLIFEKISVLLKVFSTNSPNRLKTLSVCQNCFESVFCKTLCVLPYA